ARLRRGGGGPARGGYRHVRAVPGLVHDRDGYRPGGAGRDHACGGEAHRKPRALTHRIQTGPPRPETRATLRRRQFTVSAAAPAPAQIRPRPLTASRSWVSSATEASMRCREKSLISRSCTISHWPPLERTGKEEMSPSGTP